MILFTSWKNNNYTNEDRDEIIKIEYMFEIIVQMRISNTIKIFNIFKSIGTLNIIIHTI